MYGGLYGGGEICCESVDACFEGEYGDQSCKYEICDVFSAKRFHVLPAFAEYVFLHDAADIGHKQKQYHQHVIDRTFEKCDDGGIPGEDVYAEGAKDAEAVIGVLVQRHRVKCRYPDVYSRKVVEQDE